MNCFWNERLVVDLYIYIVSKFDVILYCCYDFVGSIQETSCYMAVWVLWEGINYVPSFHFNVSL